MAEYCSAMCASWLDKNRLFGDEIASQVDRDHVSK